MDSSGGGGRRSIATWSGDFERVTNLVYLIRSWPENGQERDALFPFRYATARPYHAFDYGRPSINLSAKDIVLRLWLFASQFATRVGTVNVDRT